MYADSYTEKIVAYTSVGIGTLSNLICYNFRNDACNFVDTYIATYMY